MRFIFTADIHLSRYSQDKIEIKTNLPERLNSISNVFDNMIKYAKTENINKIVIGGDLLHGKSIIYTIAQKVMLDLFRNNLDIEFIIIDGNHDLSGKAHDAISALESLNTEPNVKRIKDDYYFDEENDILYVPYSMNMVEIIKNNSAKFLISHFGLNEGMLNSGISIVADIGMKDLIGKYKYVLLGHYHKPQDIITESISIYYSGSPIQLDWGEKNEIKRFLDVDSDSENIISVPTEGYKKYIEYKITDDNKDDIDEIIKKANSDKNDGEYVNIIKETKDFDFHKLDEMKDFNIVDKTEKDITNRGISANMNQKERFKKYLEINEIEDENTIKKYLDEAISIANSIG